MSGILDPRSERDPDGTTALAAPTASAPSAVGWANPATPSTRTARALWRRLLLGRDTDAVWVRPALVGLLALTALLYLWGLGRSGWANSYYAAAVEAGTKSWKAFFFGSFDAGNYITVDKTPASLWAMVLSARLFGLSSWSLLAPQALMGVATVGFTYASVRRWWGPAGGLLAGGVVALTPVAAMMFRYDNPDALLTLVARGRGIRRPCGPRRRAHGLAGAGGRLGGPRLPDEDAAGLRRPARVRAGLPGGRSAPPGPSHLAVAGGAGCGGGLGGLVGGVVELWPASSRPLIGGSTTNSILQLTFGYNGSGPAHGQRDRRRWPRRGAALLGIDGPPASVHPRDGGRDLLAAAGGIRGAGRRSRPRGRGVAPRAPRRPATGACCGADCSSGVGGCC